jgi:hypothetical protein
MATLATWYNRWAETKRESAAAPSANQTASTRAGYHGYQSVNPVMDYRLRAFPNDDVSFYVKKVDNTRVVRAADPQGPRVCWKLIGGASAAAVLLIGLLLPSGYTLVAGYQIENLKKDQHRLKEDLSTMDLEEAKLLSPERLAELAAQQRFIDPEPGRVIYLEKSNDTTLAAVRQPGR